jgi:hypothetical protein
MPYINDEGGKLNNFAREPEVYEVEPLSSDQKRNYVIVGVIGLALIGGLIVVSFAVS